MDFTFFLTSALLGLGLAMDAFSVSLADGLQAPKMNLGKAAEIAAIFAVFQGFMPLLGWFCVHTATQYFSAFQPFIPYIALALLLYIGGKMLYDGFHPEGEESCTARLCLSTLLLQGVATSIDALSVGFTIAEYNGGDAALSALTISLVTFATCLAGVLLGHKCGTRMAGRATTLGGIILIVIGVEIFITGVFG